MKTGFIEVKDHKGIGDLQEQAISLPITQPKWNHKTFEELKFKLLLINGPNLNMLGRRDPEYYGKITLKDVEEQSAERALSRGFKLDCYQSNHEGAIIDRIHQAMDECDGIIINPGAYTHYSYAIHDALELCALPVIEVHISDISSREDFRRISVTKTACIAQVKGLGINSYLKGIDILCDSIEKNLNRRIK